MATGERKFSTEGRTVASGFEPFPAGTYNLILKQVEVKCANGPGKVPYCAAQFEAEGTAKSEGGKNRILFHNFLLSLKPGKDGIVSHERGGGITAFALAINQNMTDVDIVTVEGGESGDVEALDAREVAAWLRELVGTEVKAKVKVRKDPTYGDKNEVDRFIPAEG